MKFSLKKEFPLIIIVVLPFVYLAYIWNSLPEKVPMHWNIKGEIDGWGSKDELVLMLFLLPILVYALLLVIPSIDPKKKIEKMGKKFYQLKFLMVLFISLIAILILYTAQNQSLSNIKIVYALVGFLIIGLGNYFQTLKPNYFIGIRTPWTLENEIVWKETHKLGGKLWFFGGALLTLVILVLPVEKSFIVFIMGVGILVIVPIVFSYTQYKAIKS